MKYIICFLLLLFNLSLVAQNCLTSGASLDKIYTNNDGKYILVKDYDKFPDGHSKIFDAQDGKLLYKYPSKKPIAEQEKLGFTEATMKGFTGKNDQFIYWEDYLNNINNKYLEQTTAKIERYYDILFRENAFRFTWPVTGGDSKVYEAKSLSYYYNIAENWGLLNVYVYNYNRREFESKYFKLVIGQKPDKIRNFGEFRFSNMIYLPKQKIVINNEGKVYDVEKNKIIEINIFKVKGVYLGANLKGALLNEDETVLAFSTNYGMTFMDMQNFKVLGNYEDANKGDKNLLPLFGLKSFVYNSALYQSIQIIKEGQVIELCDPKSKDDQKAFYAWNDLDQANKRGSYTPFVDPDVITYEKTVTAYNQLLNNLAASDRDLNPKLEKIMKSGKDAWILYETRADAHKLLRNQASSIRDFIKKYKAFITQNTLNSLNERLTITEQTDAKF